jgi:hypothetical protein
MMLAQMYVKSECGATMGAASLLNSAPVHLEQRGELAAPLFAGKHPSLFSVCIHPLSRYSAEKSWTAPGSPNPTVTNGNFTLYADVPGKPGWISSTPGSTIQFKLRFGLAPKLSISYLRSYEGFGVGQIEFPDNKRILFDSRWEQKVSQTFTSTYDAHQVFRIKQAVEVDVEIKFVRNHDLQFGERIKILEVLSC